MGKKIEARIENLEREHRSRDRRKYTLADLVLEAKKAHPRELVVSLKADISTV